MRIGGVFMTCLLLGLVMAKVRARRTKNKQLHVQDSVFIGHSIQVIVNQTSVCATRSDSDDNRQMPVDDDAMMPTSSTSSSNPDYVNLMLKLEYDLPSLRKREDNEASGEPIVDVLDTTQQESLRSNDRRSRRSVERRGRGRSRGRNRGRGRGRGKSRLRCPKNLAKSCLPPHCFGIENTKLVNNRGWITKIACCNQRGSTSPDNALELCTTCMATTTLPSNYFPREFSEVICLSSLTKSHGGTSGCLYHSGTWHGKCGQRAIYQHIFKRKNTGCNVPTGDGKNLSVEDWKLENVLVRSGCECRMKKQSLLRSFVDDGRT